jgi:hypothetical protein
MLYTVSTITWTGIDPQAEGYEMASRNLLPGNRNDAHITSSNWMSVAIIYNTGSNP